MAWAAAYQFISKEQKILGGMVPRSVLLGLLGVCLMYISVAGVVSVTAPWLVRGDGTVHLDYVWRVSKGEIPKRTDGVTYQPFVEEQGKSKPQSASKSPPLFYLIHAPVTGMLMKSGHWEAAIFVGRFINIGIGLFCIGALAWGGWLYGGKKKSLYAVATPALSILIYRFTRLNVDFALDVLLVLFTTLTVVFSYKIIMNGPSRKGLALLTLTLIGGMLTKISFIVFLAIGLISIVVSFYLHAKRQIPRSILKGIIVAFLVLGLVVLFSGWHYYLYNYKVSGGNWVNAVPVDNLSSTRQVRTLKDVLLSDPFHKLFYGSFIRQSSLTKLLTIVAGVGIFAQLLNVKFAKLLRNKKQIAVFVLLFLAYFGTLATQIEHGVGTGSINFRYMLPALLPVGLALSCGLLFYAKLRGQLVVLAATIMGLLTFDAYALAKDSNYEFGLIAKLHGIFISTNLNNVSAILPAILLGLFLVGCLLLSYSMFFITNNKKEKL